VNWKRCCVAVRREILLNLVAMSAQLVCLFGVCLTLIGLRGEFNVYDSFAGLPEKTSADNSAAGEQFKAGELLAPRKTFVYNFKKAGLKLPIIHKGWFADFTPDDVPEDISFAFFDGDFYESIADSFRVCAGKFHEKVTIIVDDYANEALPGAARAVDEWLSRNQQFVLRTEASLAIISSCSKT